MGKLRVVGAHTARAWIAELVAPVRSGASVGTIRLRDHQLDAVARLEEAMLHYGGAMLCDPVGTGKTFTALAIASRYQSTTVVAPAALQDMWLRSAALARVSIRFVSHESLSRTDHVQRSQGLVIVDEAHHARNPATKRYRALSKLVDGTDVLLMTATPVHNHPRDLVALQSLYLGKRAATLERSEISGTVIRRESDATGLPGVAPTRWLVTPHDERVPQFIIELPPSLPPREGGVAEVLVRHSLVRQWASSDAAVRLALKRRLHRAHSLISALESGKYPTNDELSAWVIGDDAAQLAFPELIVERSGNISDLLPVVRTHARAVEQILAMLGPCSERDRSTAALIRELATEHAGTPVIAFSAYEETISALYKSLVHLGGVAALTGHRGTVAGGHISRREVIERFAPIASGCFPPAAANRVSVLLTTDILSEGLNLQDAGVVIHIDLPFTNARLEQRVGRLARIGSPHAMIHSYAFRPPAPAEVISRIESLLGLKLSFELDARATPGLSAEANRRLARWRGDLDQGAGVAAAVATSKPGFLAVVRSSNGNRLVAGTAQGVTDDPAALLDAIDQAEGMQALTAGADIQRCVLAIQAHLAVDASLDGLRSSSARKAVHQRINRTVAHARPHARPVILSLAERARFSANRRGGAAFDDFLATLMESSTDDREFLERLAAVDSVGKACDREEAAILALILFVPT